jgi:hypothetical protein
MDRIEQWMMEETKKFLEGLFLEATVDYFPRGAGDAVLYRVEGRPSHTDPRRLMHQLWVDRSFYGRCADRSAVTTALEGADLAVSMKKAGDKIVELH